MSNSSPAEVVPPLTTPQIPSSNPLFGHFLDFIRDPLGFLTDCSRRGGDFVTLRFGPFPVCLVNHPALIEEVLMTKDRLFIKGRAGKMNRRLLGNGLLTSDGEVWRRQRRMVQPAFHHAQIVRYAEVMLETTQKLTADWKTGEVRDLKAEMLHLSLENLSRCLFGTDADRYFEDVAIALEAVSDHFNTRVSQLFLVPEWVPTADNRRFNKTVRRLNQIVYSIIEQRRSHPMNAANLLSLLLQVREETEDGTLGTGLTDQEVRDQVMILLLAGHETVSTALSWAWYLLSQDPQAIASLEAELQTVLADRPPTVKDLPQLRFTEAVMLESMRLYPPAWIFTHEAAEDCDIGGHPITKGTTVLLSPWVTHRDRRFFPNPDSFQPDRWLNNLAKELPTYAYFPFGGGSRICIGKPFAMMEAVIVLAAIAQKFRFELLPDQAIAPYPSVSLRPKHGIKMTVVRR